MPKDILRVIRQRAALYQIIRDYFQHQAVLEVEVPTLGKSSALDPHLASMSLESQGETYYLQTSPELFMKRLLAQGSGAIFAICKSFRDAETSARHNPEFTMLEWYRPGFDLESLIGDLSSLMERIIPGIEFAVTSYVDLFQRCLGVNPHRCPDAELSGLTASYTGYKGELDRSASLDLLMARILESSVEDGPLFVVNYPACQAAMARIAVDKNGDRVARRFEFYARGTELANGYLELTDGEEQRARFARDARVRKALGLPIIPEDKNFLKALDSGLPQCSGVALGLDRLLWLQQSMSVDGREKMDIGSQILFPWRTL